MVKSNNTSNLKETLAAHWSFCLAFGFSFLLILFFNIYTQDGSPLLYQGWLFNEYIENNFETLGHIFKYSPSYTSWGGVLLSSVSIKLLDVNHAEKLLQLVHLFLFYLAFYFIAKYIDLKKKIRPYWWVVVTVLFWSYTFGKGFYNYLYAVDFLLLAIPHILSSAKTSKSYIIIGVVFLAMALCHPLPALVGFLLISVTSFESKKMDYKSIAFFLPTLLFLGMHFSTVESSNSYENYSIVNRIGEFVLGLTLASYKRSEFIYIAVFVLAIQFFYIVGLFKTKDKKYILILVSFVVIYLIAPEETSGGGLITFRLAWLILLFQVMYIFTHVLGYSSLIQQSFKVFIFIGILLLAFKTMIVVDYQNDKVICFNQLDSQSKVVRLYHQTTPTKSSGWLAPIFAYQIQKKCI
ncbi:MAG: hypothetical protein HYZ42_15945, partial [Bacteroidetes bacterium]|nr:hypothetical protein [Bacteroidota bacterium]